MARVHILRPTDLSAGQRATVFARAEEFKHAERAPRSLSGLRVGALYLNPSLRTRVSFEQAVGLIGGRCQNLNSSLDTWGLEMDPQAVMDGDAVENIVEAARVLGRYVHLLGVRSFRGNRPWAEERQEPVLSAFAEHAGVPVLSLEGAVHHPCQSLADVLTLKQQFGQNLRGLPVALCWAWHPKALPMAVPHSFLVQAALEGCTIDLVHPPGFDLDPEVVATARAAAQDAGGQVSIHHERTQALRGKQVVYVKSWGPLGTNAPTPQDLRPWCIDEDVLAGTDNGRVMHCLPVRRNVVISSAVLDGPRSLVTEQAENRMWAQAALLEEMLAAEDLAP